MKTLPLNIESNILKSGYGPRIGIVFDYFNQNLATHGTFTTDAKTYTGLINGQPQISIDSSRLGGMAQIGTCNISIVNQGQFSDILQTYPYPENTDVDFYIYFPDVDGNYTEADSFKFFSGIIADFPEVNERSFEIMINSRDTFDYANKLIGELITLEDYPKAAADIVGTVKPIVFGDHVFNLGNLTGASFTYSQKHNMMKMIPIYSTASYSRLYLVSGHELSSVDGIYYYDSKIKRNVELTEYTVIQNTSDAALIEIGETVNSGSTGNYDSANPSYFSRNAGVFTGGQAEDILVTIIDGTLRYYLIKQIINITLLEVYEVFTDNVYTSHEGTYDITYRILSSDVYFYDYYSGNGNAINNPYTPGEDWVYPEKASNKDTDNGCTVTSSGTWTNYVNEVYFDYWDNDDIEDANIEEVAIYARGITGQVDVAGCGLYVNDIAADGDDASLFRPYGTQAATQAGIATFVEIKLAETSGSPIVNAGIKELFKRIKYAYDITPTEFYCSCEGIEADATIESWFPSVIEGTLNENPISIIAEILKNTSWGLSETSATIDTTKFNSALGGRSNWKFSFAITEQINVIELLSKIAKECFSLLQIDEDGKWSAVRYSDDDTFAVSGVDTPLSGDIYEYSPKKIALSFDGTNKILFDSNADLQITGDLTIYTSIKFTTFTAGDVTKTIVGCSGTGATEAENYLYKLNHLNTSGASFQAQHQSSSGSETCTLTLDTALTLNTWYQLVFRRDISAKTYYLAFYDKKGLLIASASSSYTNDTTGGTSSVFHFGFGQKSASQRFQGSMKHLAVFDAFHETEIEDYLNKILIGEETNLVGYWRIDEYDNLVLNDITGGADGTITGADWVDTDDDANISKLDYYATNPIAKESFSLRKTTEDIATKIYIDYFLNNGKYQSRITETNNDYFTEVIEATKKFDFIRDDTTINLAGTILSDVVALKPFEVTFKTYLNRLHIESWDVINVRHFLLSGIFSESTMNTKKWHVTKIEPDYSNMEIQITAAEAITDAVSDYFDEDYFDDDYFA